MIGEKLKVWKVCSIKNYERFWREVILSRFGEFILKPPKILPAKSSSSREDSNSLYDTLRLTPLPPTPLGSEKIFLWKAVLTSCSCSRSSNKFSRSSFNVFSLFFNCKRMLPVSSRHSCKYIFSFISAFSLKYKI